MPSYLTTTLSKRRRLFAFAILGGGVVAAVVWTWLVPRRAADPFAQQYTDAELAEQVALGAALFETHHCAECHVTTRDASALGGVGLKGPPLIDLVGRSVLLEDESQVQRDHRYLRRAILDSRAEVVKGYAFQLMPDYGFLSDAEVSALLLYVRSLSDEPAQDAD
ncbi:MAG: c-type cytochrome [Phycisphaerales bacterium JB063]